MSKYTTSLLVAIQELTPDMSGESWSKRIDSALPLIFNFDFPCWEEEHKVVLEKKIVMHYLQREIGVETFPLWQIYLEGRLNEIMPYYIDKYNAIYPYIAELYNNINYTDKYTEDFTSDVKRDFSENVDTTGENDYTRQNDISEVEDSVVDKTLNEKTTSNESINMTGKEESKGNENKVSATSGSKDITGNETGSQTEDKTASSSKSGSDDKTIEQSDKVYGTTSDKNVVAKTISGESNSVLTLNTKETTGETKVVTTDETDTLTLDTDEKVTDDKTVSDNGTVTLTLNTTTTNSLNTTTTDDGSSSGQNIYSEYPQTTLADKDYATNSNKQQGKNDNIQTVESSTTDKRTGTETTDTDNTQTFSDNFDKKRTGTETNKIDSTVNTDSDITKSRTGTESTDATNKEQTDETDTRDIIKNDIDTLNRSEKGVIEENIANTEKDVISKTKDSVESTKTSESGNVTLDSVNTTDKSSDTVTSDTAEKNETGKETGNINSSTQQAIADKSASSEKQNTTNTTTNSRGDKTDTVRTIIGLNGKAYSELIAQYVKTIENLDIQIIKDLAGLFMNIF